MLSGNHRAPIGFHQCLIPVRLCNSWILGTVTSHKLQATSLAGKSTTAAFCSGILLWLVLGDIFRYLSMVEKAIIHPLLQFFAGVSVNLNLGRLTNHLVKDKHLQLWQWNCLRFPRTLLPKETLSVFMGACTTLVSPTVAAVLQEAVMVSSKANMIKYPFSAQCGRVLWGGVSISGFLISSKQTLRLSKRANKQTRTDWQQVRKIWNISPALDNSTQCLQCQDHIHLAVVHTNCETRTTTLQECSVFFRQETLCHAILLWLLFLLLSCWHSSAKNKLELAKYLFCRRNCPDLVHSNSADQPAVFSGTCSFHAKAFGRWLCLHVTLRSQSWLRAGQIIDKMTEVGTRSSLLKGWAQFFVQYTSCLFLLLWKFNTDRQAILIYVLFSLILIISTNMMLDPRTHWRFRNRLVEPPLDRWN